MTEECISSMALKYFNNLSLLCINDIFQPADQKTSAARTYLFKFSQSLPKNNYRQVFFSNVAPSIWNKLTDFLKAIRILFNTYKYV